MEELIFSWSLDGFGAKFFRITEAGNVRFVNRYCAMDLDETSQETGYSSEYHYGSFEEFWKEFTDQPSWLRYRPVFVHPDYKPFLRGFFENIPQESLTIGEQFRFIVWWHKVE